MLTEKEIEEYSARYDAVMNNEDLLDIINYKSTNTDTPTDDEEVIKNAEKMLNSPEYNEMVTGAMDLIKADKRF